MTESHVASRGRYLWWGDWHVRKSTWADSFVEVGAGVRQEIWRPCEATNQENQWRILEIMGCFNSYGAFLLTLRCFSNSCLLLVVFLNLRYLLPTFLRAFPSSYSLSIPYSLRSVIFQNFQSFISSCLISSFVSSSASFNFLLPSFSPVIFSNVLLRHIMSLSLYAMWWCSLN